MKPFTSLRSINVFKGDEEQTVKKKEKEGAGPQHSYPGPFGGPILEPEPLPPTGKIIYVQNLLPPLWGLTAPMPRKETRKKV